MFKEKKVEKFIEKYAAEFANHDYDELEEFLLGVKNITRFISKINKLPEREVNYVLSTIMDYKDYDFDQEQVDLILWHKLDLIKKFKVHENCPNLDRIYYGLVSYEWLYKLFVKEYIEYHNARNNEKRTLENYSSVLSKYNKEIRDVIGDTYSTVALREIITYLKPNHLQLFLVHENGDTTKKNKEFVLRHITSSKYKKLSSKINSLDSYNFVELLNYIFAKEKNSNETLDETTIKSRLELIEKVLIENSDTKRYVVDKRMVDNILNLPTSYLKELNQEESEIKEEKNDFIEFIDKYNDPEVLNILINKMESFQSKKTAKMFVKFIKDDFFINSDANRQKVLLDLFPGDKVSSIDESIEMVIPDYNSLKDSFDKTGNMEFINPQTKQKIIIKSKNSQND